MEEVIEVTESQLAAAFKKWHEEYNANKEDFDALGEVTDGVQSAKYLIQLLKDQTNAKDAISN